MASHKGQAQRLQHSDQTDHTEEDEVERSYKENASGNAQAAVEEFLHSMDFLQREGDLVYMIPKGTGLALFLLAAIRQGTAAVCVEDILLQSQRCQTVWRRCAPAEPIRFGTFCCRARQGHERTGKILCKS